jgi:hypothetical protein
VSILATKTMFSSEDEGLCWFSGRADVDIEEDEETMRRSRKEKESL